jgi:hypothetical protein
MVDALKRISTSNGFENSVKDVKREFLHFSNVHTFPVLMVLGGEEELEDQLGNYSVGNLQVRVRGYTKDTAEPEVALSNMIEDVIKCLENPEYNAYHARMGPKRVLTDEGWLHVDNPGLGMFEIQVMVNYRYERTNP